MPAKAGAALIASRAALQPCPGGRAESHLSLVFVSIFGIANSGILHQAPLTTLQFVNGAIALAVATPAICRRSRPQLTLTCSYAASGFHRSGNSQTKLLSLTCVGGTAPDPRNRGPLALSLARRCPR